MTARGVLTVSTLRARCRVDEVTGCWHWLGALEPRGHPRVYTFDHERGEKRTMNGAKAAFNIGFRCAPQGLPYRHCGSRDCMNPQHLRVAKSQTELLGALAALGRLKGLNVEQKRAAAHKGQRAQGMTQTDLAIVVQVREAPPTVRNIELADRFGLSQQTVSAIRLRKTYRWLGEPGRSAQA